MSPYKKDGDQVGMWHGPATTHSESNIAFVGPRGLGIQGPCISIPVVHLLLDENYQDCYMGSCVCGWKTAPFTEIEPAIVDSWRHAYPDRVSDLRKAQLKAHTNGNGTELVETLEESASATG